MKRAKSSSSSKNFPDFFIGEREDSITAMNYVILSCDNLNCRGFYKLLLNYISSTYKKKEYRSQEVQVLGLF